MTGKLPLKGWLFVPESEHLPKHFECLACGNMECLGAVLAGMQCPMCADLAPVLRRRRAKA